MSLDVSDIYAVSLMGFACVGLAAVPIRRGWAWRLELGGLLGASLLWAGFLVILLRSDAVGHDCSEPHHEGELPMLIVTLVWTAALAGAFRLWPTEMRVTVRLIPFLGSALVALATVYVLLTFQPAC